MQFFYLKTFSLQEDKEAYTLESNRRNIKGFTTARFACGIMSLIISAFVLFSKNNELFSKEVFYIAIFAINLILYFVQKISSMAVQRKERNEKPYPILIDNIISALPFLSTAFFIAFLMPYLISDSFCKYQWLKGFCIGLALSKIVLCSIFSGRNCPLSVMLLYILFFIGFSLFFHVEFFTNTYQLSLLISHSFLCCFELIANENSHRKSFLSKQKQKKHANFFRVFIEAIQDPVLIISRDNCVSFMNQAAKLRPFSFTEENYIEKLDNIHDKSSNSLLSEITRIFQIKNEPFKGIKNLSCNMETEEKSNNKKIHLAVSLIRTHFNKSTPSIVVTMKDITKVQDLEERKAELKFKNLLVYSVSHEVKTPLNGLISTMDELNRISKKKYFSLIAEGLSSAYLLLNRINLLNTYVQIKSKNLLIRSQKFSIQTLFNKLSVYISSKLGENDKKSSVSFISNVDNNVPAEIEGDPERIEIILFHMLLNACKYTAKGKIILSATVPPNDRTNIIFSVSDTGCGISEDSYQHLFRFKSGTAKFTNNKSTILRGLGMTICQMIAKEMNSLILCKTQTGEGTIFCFKIQQKCTVPIMELYEDPSCVRNESPPPRNQTLCFRASSNEETFAESHRVTKIFKEFALVVDDIQINRLVVRRLLQKQNVTLCIEEAVNGKEAVNIIKQHIRKDNEKILVLMDIDMPVMNGIEATKEILNFCDKNIMPQVEIVGITAFDSEEIIETCKKIGMSEVYKKPITIEDIQKVYQNYFN